MVASEELGTFAVPVMACPIRSVGASLVREDPPGLHAPGLGCWSEDSDCGATCWRGLDEWLLFGAESSEELMTKGD